MKFYKSTTFKFLYVFIALLSFFLGEKFNYIIALSTLSINCYDLYKCRNNWIFLLIMIFLLYFNYSIFIANYISPIESVYTNLSVMGNAVSKTSLRCLFLFTTLINLYLPKRICKIKISNMFIENKENNNIIQMGIIISLIVIIIISFSLSLGSSTRQESSSIIEYSLILMIIGFYYAGRNKVCRVIIIVLSILLCLSTILNGDRIISLSILAALFLILVSDKFNLKRTLPIAFLGLLIFTCIGELRKNITVSIDGLFKAFDQLLSTKLANDTSYAAYYSSMTFLQYAETITFSSRITFFLSFFLSILLGSSVPNSNLTIYIQNNFTWQGGGGLFPVYSYFYLGIAGVFLFSLIFIYIFKLANNKSLSNENLIYLIYIVSMTPRWYLYTPINLFRSLLIMVVVFKCSKYIYKKLLVQK